MALMRSFATCAMLLALACSAPAQQQSTGQGVQVPTVQSSGDAAARVGTRTIMLHQGEIALDVSEEERRGMTVDDLVRRFHQTRQQALVDDELLLTT